MDTIIKTQIIDLIHREVIPAIGCTEPIAVALAFLLQKRRGMTL